MSPCIEAIRGHRDKVGMWQILAYAGSERRKHYACGKCDCGIVRRVRWDAINSRDNSGCGCVGKKSGATLEFHGKSRTKEYRAWQGMLKRASDIHSHSGDDNIRRNYRDRGIVVCDQWTASFEAFLAEVGLAPSDKLTLDRIDNNRGYEPGNVRWATRRQQMQNVSYNRNITVDGVTLCVNEWARKLGIDRAVISQRLHYGWSEEDAVTRPVRKIKKEESHETF